MKISDLSKILGLIILISSAVWGGYMGLESRYASASQVQQLTNRVTINELIDLRNKVLSHIYFLREQSRKYPHDKKIKDKLLETEKEQDSIEKQIIEIKSK